MLHVRRERGKTLHVKQLIELGISSPFSSDLPALCHVPIAVHGVPSLQNQEEKRLYKFYSNRTAEVYEDCDVGLSTVSWNSQYMC